MYWYRLSNYNKYATLMEDVHNRNLGEWGEGGGQGNSILSMQSFHKPEAALKNSLLKKMKTTIKDSDREPDLLHLGICWDAA